MSKKINLSNLNVQELKELQREISRMIKVKLVEEKNAVLKQMKELAEKSGFSFNELLNDKAVKRQTVAPKYRNPKNPMQTWSGRGKKPKWVQEYIDNEGKIEDLLIK